MSIDGISALTDAIAITFPLKLLQAFRLAHALAETGLRIHVPAGEAEKFERIASVFGVEFEIGTEGVPPITDVGVDHQRPQTRIGDVARPLIFPHGIVDRCRAAWPARRVVDVSFCGLITPSRRASLEGWVGSPLEEADPGRSDTMQLAFRAVRRRGLRTYTRVEVWSSKRGRSYPGKAWDEEYFRLLARSRFVLCPSGDFVWTYRFFESILCGAIPIVEASSDAYDGFSYFTQEDDLANLTYDPDRVDANHARAVELLTVPREELRLAALAALTT